MGGFSNSLKLVLGLFTPFTIGLAAIAAVTTGVLLVALDDVSDAMDNSKKSQEDLNQALSDYYDLIADEDQRADKQKHHREEEIQGTLRSEERRVGKECVSTCRSRV